VGYRPLLHFVSGTFTGQVVAIHEAIDIKTKKVLEQNPKSAGGVGKLFTMTIASKVARAIEPYSKSPAFGRFFLTDNKYARHRTRNTRAKFHPARFVFRFISCFVFR
jgi:translation elongation factor EF-1alpha